MAVSLPNFRHHHQYLKFNPIQSSTTIISNPNCIRFPTSLTKFKIATFNSASIIEPLAPEDSYNGRKHNPLSNSEKLADYIPGGSWWNLEDDDNEAGEMKSTNSITVWYVLRRIWGLVADDKLVVYIGFGSLTFAALAEITIPSLLTASIFAAQNGETLVFYKNLKVLTFLCFASGICRGTPYAVSRGSAAAPKTERYTSEADTKGTFTRHLPDKCLLGHFALLAEHDKGLESYLLRLLLVDFSGLRGGCFAIANMVLVSESSSEVGTLSLMYSVLNMTIGRQDVSFFDRESVGNLTSRLGVDCQKLSHIIGNNLHLIARNSLQVDTFVKIHFAAYKLQLFSLQFRFETKVLSHHALEVIALLLFRYKQWLDKLAITSMRESAAYGLWNLSFSTLYRSTQVFAIVLGGMSILTGHASAEQLTKYVLYCEWLIYAAWRLADNFSSLLQSVGASEKVFQLIDVLPSSSRLCLDYILGNLVIKLQPFETKPGHMMLASGPEPEMPTLEEVNLYVQANEVIAIVRNFILKHLIPSDGATVTALIFCFLQVGLSGSGKSTLVHLLLGLYEPTHGEILINGHPLKDLDIRWLRENIGYVGQEPHLFRMDIKSNISYGCSREIKQEDVEWAAKQAYAHEFICSLPDGYETIVDDELLSGGQKQRIAIARAIVRDPSILILDEPTSALDAESEYYIQELMVRLKTDTKAKRSILFIAHRLSTARAADRIVVMDGGRIVEKVPTYIEEERSMGPFTKCLLDKLLRPRSLSGKRQGKDRESYLANVGNDSYGPFTKRLPLLTLSYNILRHQIYHWYLVSLFNPVTAYRVNVISITYRVRLSVVYGFHAQFRKDCKEVIPISVYLITCLVNGSLISKELPSLRCLSNTNNSFSWPRMLDNKVNEGGSLAEDRDASRYTEENGSKQPCIQMLT
ncbi:hypothetical protein OSB04_007729 [Centaurea solstitialis]|uniref:ABC transporter domain-containing protein n=1 Tax=Centaurea solstitialis TaxID=347529 RepID=A0AA38TM43_9ASTR|nr:hypothetical protein OSB04_007729 [Centaurea solstitialis]